MDREVPSFPIFYCSCGDPRGLYVLEDQSAVEHNLVEDAEIEHKQYSAWDSKGSCLVIAFSSRADSEHSLDVSIAVDSPKVDQRFLLHLVVQYGELNKANMAKLEGESPLAFYKRIETELERMRWENHPWLRRLFGWSSPSAHHNKSGQSAT